MSIVVGKSYNWGELNTEERYDFWSLHITHGGIPLNFFAFCDLMDKKTGSELVAIKA